MDNNSNNSSNSDSPQPTWPPNPTAPSTNPFSIPPQPSAPQTTPATSSDSLNGSFEPNTQIPSPNLSQQQSSISDYTNPFANQNNSQPTPSPMDSTTNPAQNSQSGISPSTPLPPSTPIEAAPTIPDFLQSWGNQPSQDQKPQESQPTIDHSAPTAAPMNETPNENNPFLTPPTETPPPTPSASATSPFFAQQQSNTFSTPTNDSVIPPSVKTPDTSTLSQLVEANSQTPPPAPTPQQATNLPQPAQKATGNTISHEENKGMNKMLIACGIILLLVIFSAAGYFIWLSTKSTPVSDQTSLPAEQTPLTNPPKPIVQESQDTTGATNSATVNSSPSPSPSGQSALDILKEKALQSSTSSAKK